MRNTLSLGTIFGLELRATFSWLIAFGLVVGYLGSDYFPTTYPGWTSGAKLSATLATALLFFASLVAHELGHHLAAKRLGLSSPHITLSVFGSLSGSSERDRPRDEFLIAAAGPLASFLLALGFGLLAWAGPDRVGLPLAAFSRWLGLANLALALFNLFPGLPLDGGRMLRAVARVLTHNPKTATLIAGVGGKSVAFGLILWGVQLIFRGNWPVGLLVTLIGWLVNHAALQSMAQAILQDLLGGHTAREAMMTDCPRVGPTLTVQKLVDEVVLTSGRSCFLVLGGTRVIGLITVNQIRTVPQAQRATTTVGSVMVPLKELEVVSPDADLYKVFAKLTRSSLSRLPVMDNGKLVGMIGFENIQAFLQAHANS